MYDLTLFTGGEKEILVSNLDDYEKCYASIYVVSLTSKYFKIVKFVSRFLISLKRFQVWLFIRTINKGLNS